MGFVTEGVLSYMRGMPYPERGAFYASRMEPSNVRVIMSCMSDMPLAWRIGIVVKAMYRDASLLVDPALAGFVTRNIDLFTTAIEVFLRRRYAEDNATLARIAEHGKILRRNQNP